MKMLCLHNKKDIERFLRRNTFLHIYSIGDLDDAFWPSTAWYGLVGNAGLEAVTLVYYKPGWPVVIALGDETKPLAELLRLMLRALPRRFYAHLSPGLSPVLEGDYSIASRAPHIKMGFTDPAAIHGASSESVVKLSKADVGELLGFYETSYPGNTFMPSTLDTGQYFGIRDAEGLVSVAGVHIYSPTFKVAAIGNVATRPDQRGKGHARAVLAALCRNLARTVDHIGLNVKADNDAAIRGYRSLGFEVVGEYEEFSFEEKKP